jgi:hypothetical protein
MSLYIICIILNIFLLYSIFNINCKRTSTDLFFTTYSPKNRLLPIPNIFTSYNELVYSLNTEKSISVSDFSEIFELLTVNILINWVIETLEEKEETKKLKNHIRILNLIDKYTSVFIIDDIDNRKIKISFIYKLIDSLKFLNQENIFLIYKYIENIYIDNVYFHTYIKIQFRFNPPIESLEINSSKLQNYLEFIKTKNINILHYI